METSYRLVFKVVNSGRMVSGESVPSSATLYVATIRLQPEVVNHGREGLVLSELEC